MSDERVLLIANTNAANGALVAKKLVDEGTKAGGLGRAEFLGQVDGERPLHHGTAHRVVNLATGHGNFAGFRHGAQKVTVRRVLVED